MEQSSILFCFQYELKLGCGRQNCFCSPILLAFDLLGASSPEPWSVTASTSPPNKNETFAKRSGNGIHGWHIPEFMGRDSPLRFSDSSEGTWSFGFVVILDTEGTERIIGTKFAWNGRARGARIQYETVSTWEFEC